MIRTQNPVLSRRFPKDYAFFFEDYNDNELLEIFQNACRSKNILISSWIVEQRALKVLNRQKANANFGNAGAVNLLVDNAISKAAQRLSESTSIVLIPDDIAQESRQEFDPHAIFDSLYNVDKIKKQIIHLHNKFKVAEREGEKRPSVGHFVFQRSPGILI